VASQVCVLSPASAYFITTSALRIVAGIDVAKHSISGFVWL
jgi:hypothetical protein